MPLHKVHGDSRGTLWGHRGTANHFNGSPVFNCFDISIQLNILAGLPSFYSDPIYYGGQ